MGDTAATNAALQVSVSFGRFEGDSLCWEKWSTFSPNKYMEEVEKCATPGSVAMKKAYFEAHYKKIAARKAELADEWMKTESGSFRSGERNGDLNSDTDEATFEIDTCKEESHPEGAKQVKSLFTKTNSVYTEEPNEDDLITIECQSLSVLGLQEAQGKDLQNADSDESDDSLVQEEVQQVLSNSDNLAEEIILVKEEEEVLPPIESLGDTKEIEQYVHNEVDTATKYEAKKVEAKLNWPKNPQKTVASSRREQNVVTVHKKVGSPVVKSPKMTTPRVSKPLVSASPLKASSKSASKLGTSPSLPRIKSASLGEKKRVVPKVLHMSISLGSASPHSASPATRTSLIMERMGDKDIVKRAFKMFQNDVGQLKSSGEDFKSVAPEEGEQKASISMSNRKENGGPIKAGSTPQRGSRPPTTSTGPGGTDRVGKQKELPMFMRKLKETTKANNTGKLQLQSKSKEEKKVDLKNARQSPSHRGTLMLAQPGQSKLRNNLKKVIDKTEIHR